MPLTVDQRVRNPQEGPDSQLGSEQGQGDVACSPYQGSVVENGPNAPLTTVNGGVLDADKVHSTWSGAGSGRQPRRKVDLEPSKKKLMGDHDSTLAAEQEIPGSPHSAEQQEGDVGGTPGVVVDKGIILGADKTRQRKKQPRKRKSVDPSPDPKKEAVSESDLPPQVVKGRLPRKVREEEQQESTGQSHVTKDTSQEVEVNPSAWFFMGRLPRKRAATGEEPDKGSVQPSRITKDGSPEVQIDHSAWSFVGRLPRKRRSRRLQ